METLKDRLQKVMQKAEEYGINDEIKQEERNMRDEKKNIEKEALLRKKKVMLQAFESQKKKTDILIIKEKKEFKELCGKRNQLNQQLDEKVVVLKEKTQQMSELIEKAKKYSDPNTQELLKKWEQSNQKMKDMYDAEAEEREEQKNTSKQPNPKDIDRLINKMQKDKPPSRKDLPVVKTHKKSMNDIDLESESKHSRSVISNQKQTPSERKSIVSSNSKPPLNISSKISDRNDSPDEENSEVMSEVKSEIKSQKYDLRSNSSKPSFTSKPFGKPSFASKPAFGARAPSNESRSKPGSRQDYESIPDVDHKIDQKPPSRTSDKPQPSFSEKYGLNKEAPKPAVQEESKIGRFRAPEKTQDYVPSGHQPSQDYVPSGHQPSQEYVPSGHQPSQEYVPSGHQPNQEPAQRR